MCTYTPSGLNAYRGPTLHVVDVGSSDFASLQCDCKHAHVMQSHVDVRAFDWICFRCDGSELVRKVSHVDQTTLIGCGFKVLSLEKTK